MALVRVQNTPLTLKNVLTTYSDVSKKELGGTFSRFKVKLFVKPASKPQFFRVRQVPYVIRDAVDREPKHLESLGVIESVAQGHTLCCSS